MRQSTPSHQPSYPRSTLDAPNHLDRHHKDRDRCPQLQLPSSAHRKLVPRYQKPIPPIHHFVALLPPPKKIPLKMCRLISWESCRWTLEPHGYVDAVHESMSRKALRLAAPPALSRAARPLRPQRIETRSVSSSGHEPRYSDTSLTPYVGIKVRREARRTLRIFSVVDRV
jgi:hypothetical protein